MVNDDAISAIEDLVMDFLVYRKTRKTKDYPIKEQYEIGKGWPHYSSLSLPGAESWELLFNELSEGEAKQKMHESDSTGAAILSTSAELPFLSMESLHGATEDEMKHMEGMYSELCKKLQPCVREVLSAYEYEGSPVYEDNIGPAVIEQMVDKIVDHAGGQITEIVTICGEKDGAEWGRHHLLRTLVETMVLVELFGRRRPGYRKMFRDNWNYMAFL